MRESSVHIKLLMCICACTFSLASLSQEKTKIERLWFNTNYGFNLYGEVGGHIQIFDQFLLGAYYQNFRRNVGPGIAENPYALFIKRYRYTQDKISSGSVMIGFASPTPYPVMFSFLGGPSLNKSVIHSDFQIIDPPNSSKFVSSVEDLRWIVGFNYKATLSFIIDNQISLNFGLAGNYNGIVNYNRFVFGVGIGDFGCFSDRRKLREVKE